MIASNFHSVRHDIEAASNVRPKIWIIIVKEYEKFDPLYELKTETKTWYLLNFVKNRFFIGESQDKTVFKYEQK